MNWKKNASTLVLLAVAAPLAVYAYLDRASISDGERRDRQTDVFPAYRRQDVHLIELVAGSEKTVIERRPEPDSGEAEWWMTSPREERADAASVDKLLGDIEFAGIVRKVDPGVGAFDAPRVTGTLGMGALVYHFALGSAAPTPEGAAYFRVDGEGAFVVSKDFVASLLKGPDSYRERTIVPYLSLELQRLEVTGHGAKFALERIDDVSFRLPDLGLRASRETLDRVWGALAEARAESFLSDEEAERALGPDPLRIEMKPRDGRKDGEILVGGVCPGHPEDTALVRHAPTRRAACVPKGMIPGLVVTSAELVDKRLFAARGDEIAEIVLESVPPGTKVEIARKGSGWHERAPNDRELSSEEAEAASALATSLAKGEGTDPTPGDPKAPFAAVARVRIQRGEGKGEEGVELGAKVGVGALVRRASDGATLHVSESLAHKLVPSEIVFRGRKVFPISLTGKIATGLETECDGNVQVVSRVDGGWTYDKPSGFHPDSAVVVSTVDTLVRVEAQAWVANVDDGSFGFKDAGCAITVTFDEDGGPRRAGLVLGREAEGGGHFAHVLGEEPVFIAPPSIHGDAGRLLVDRTGFHVDRDEVDSITLSRGSTKLVFSGRDKKIRLPDGGGAELAEKVASALEGMRADEVVHLGPARPEEGFGHAALDVRVEAKTDAGPRKVHFVVGDSATILKERMFYARLDGVDATFALARDRVIDLTNAL